MELENEKLLLLKKCGDDVLVTNISGQEEVVGSFSEGDKKIVETLEIAKKRINKLDEKRKNIFCDWVKTKTDYILKEKDFDPKKLKAYSRGEVVLVELGYNVGNEYGGEHYVVVLKNSSKTNSLLNVIPLTSMKEDITGMTEDEIVKLVHKESLYIGNIEGLSDKKSVAIVNQIITISKIRVITPKSARQESFKISDEYLDKIDEMVISIYTKGV